MKMKRCWINQVIWYRRFLQLGTELTIIEDYKLLALLTLVNDNVCQSLTILLWLGIATPRVGGSYRSRSFLLFYIFCYPKVAGFKLFLIAGIQ